MFNFSLSDIRATSSVILLANEESLRLAARRWRVILLILLSQSGFIILMSIQHAKSGSRHISFWRSRRYLSRARDESLRTVKGSWEETKRLSAQWSLSSFLLLRALYLWSVICIPYLVGKGLAGKGWWGCSIAVSRGRGFVREGVVVDSVYDDHPKVFQYWRLIDGEYWE